MKDYIVFRVNEIANHIVETHQTIRQTAKKFGVSKSTIHKDILQRLPIVNPVLFKEVEEVVQHNKSMRHIRGGIATRLKFKGEL